MFDFANPDLHIPQRSETTVPQQALFALNHPYVAACARALVGRLEIETARHAENTDRTRVDRLFLDAWQRLPTDEERHEAIQFVEWHATEASAANDLENDSENAAWQYGYMTIDEGTEKPGEFRVLPYFDGRNWQGGAQFPDTSLGWLQLNAQGGHPGNDLQHVVVRRWIAPRAMSIRVESQIIHEPEAGDGIRAWIFSSRSGKLGSWRVHHRQQEARVETLEVAAGETIDFAVDIHRELNSDQFLWAPVIVESAPADHNLSESHRWDAVQQFHGPRTSSLTEWEQLAQIMLLANEFMFVD